MAGIYHTDWTMFAYNPVTNVYERLRLEDALIVGKGYWIVQLSQSATLDMPVGSQPVSVKSSPQCLTSACFESALVTTGDVQYQMLANPFHYSVEGADLRVNTNGESGLTLQEASANTLVNKIWGYNGEGYDQLQNQLILPWTGVWVATLPTASINLPPKLLFPSKNDISHESDCATGFIFEEGRCVADPNDNGVTYFVRTDGGTHLQCNGLSNNPYNGSSNQCAWDHPWRAMPPQGSSNISPFKGGDTLILADGE